MKRSTKFLAALFGLLMMVLPSIASAEVVFWPQYARPVVQEAVVPAPYVAPAPYYAAPYAPAYWHRPWPCSNPYFRHHHWRMCR
jgi:hypothetical protein